MIEKTYVIHPYESTGTVQDNRDEEETIVQELQAMGCSLYLVRPFKRINEHMKRRKALKMGFKLLSKCKNVLLTGDWQNSSGCMAELKKALEEGKTVLEYKDGKILKWNTYKTKEAALAASEELRNGAE